MSAIGYHIAPTDAAPTDAAAGGTARTAVPDRERRHTTIGLAELVCADPQWLHREFAELIAANYPPSAAAPARTGPPGGPSVATHRPRPTRNRLGGPQAPRPGPRTRHGRDPAPADGRARQRSPPNRHTRRRHRVDESRPG
ncbi:hypothetical protein [Pseudonocardia endophytica]|uniref:Uncharacterized protein n=1 Tax=Pseudonocardia endophytica TaxID=401976 RepID=A0A4R1HH87_PSEEN|nr:hypothetical protein [Pseudonocardia endophytica]TCK21098.1 hypothetical protein EV378_5073 [Pseudonocardia endophytica]